MAKPKSQKAEQGIILLLLIFVIAFAGIIYLVYHAYTIRHATELKTVKQAVPKLINH